METINIDGIQYQIPRPPLKSSIIGLEFIIKHYGKSVIDVVLKAYDNTKTEVTPDMFDSFLKVFQSKPGLIYETFEMFLNSNYVLKNNKEFDLEEVYHEKGANHLFRLLFKVLSENYFSFFLSNTTKKKD